MSAIFGLFRFDGAPVDSQTLHRMRDAEVNWQADAGGLHLAGPVGLGC